VNGAVNMAERGVGFGRVGIGGGDWVQKSVSGD